jgi:sulfhydrogenase subunit beta (sulfur reductase)
MSGKVFVARNDLAAALGRLAEKIDVWVPVASGENRWGVEFKPFQPGMVPVLDRQSTSLPKKVLFPQVETLFRFEYVKDSEDPSKVRIQVDDELAVKPALVFGARPCDVRGFLVFDRVFQDGPHTDVYYKKRRENTLFATLLCNEADDACFCSSVGSGPADQEGSDIWVVPVEDGFVIEAINERGKSYLDLLGSSPNDVQSAAAKKAQEEAASKFVGAPGLKENAEAFPGRFADKEYWQEMVSQCLSCGICTYVCPTCYCFSITDEMKDLKGERMRSWDSCMFPHYTHEASGHNPRPTKFERYRNRLGHKFSYIPEKYDGLIGCCGCGRCIRSCPVSVDIRKIVHHLKENVHACA